MANVYADTGASGDNDGTTWVHAYNSVTSGLSSAFADLNDGDTLYANAPASNPFRESNIDGGGSNRTYIFDQGTDGVTYLTDGRISSSWTGSGPIYQLTLAAKPTHVVYDFKQDNATGTVTGCDFSTARIQQAIARFGVTEADLYPYYGFLEENTGTPSSPAEGEWGHTGGVLYINPPGTPTLATVKLLAQYCPGGQNAIEIGTGTNTTIGPGLVGLLWPDQLSNKGYVIKFSGSGTGDGNTITGCKAYAAGWHAFGMVGDADDNRAILSCISVGLTGDEVGTGESAHFVGTVATNGTYSHQFRNCICIGVPRLLTTGAPASDSLNTGHKIVLTHTSGSATVYNGVIVDNCLQIDFQDELEAKHSVVLTDNGRQVGMSGGTTPSSRTTWADYTNTVTNSWFVGRGIHDGAIVGYRYCLMDRSASGRTTLAGEVATGYYAYFDCALFLGEYVANGEYINGIGAGDVVVFNKSHVYGNAAAAKQAMMRIDGAEPDENLVSLISSKFDSSGGVDCTIKSTNNYNTDYDDVDSDGGNVFGDSLGTGNSGGVVRHNNSSVAPRDITWWTTDANSLAVDADRATDTQSDVGWTDAASGTSLLGMEALLNPTNVSGGLGLSLGVSM